MPLYKKYNADNGLRDFNFAIPELPYISGRELAGEVVLKPSQPSRLRVGDRVGRNPCALTYLILTNFRSSSYRRITETSERQRTSNTW
jgi:NADPH:quinone reductase-like Zn-dependent oxidoreductase